MYPSALAGALPYISADHLPPASREMYFSALGGALKYISLRGNHPERATVHSAMDTRPFCGSRAVAAGVVTAKELRGPRFRRLYPDVYVAASVEVDLQVRSRAAYELVRGQGVLGGWSAAELLGASCARVDAPAEVVVSYRTRGCVGLLVRHDVLAPDEIVRVDGVPVTIPLRTAFDLARRPPLVEAVVAMDALARVCGVDLADVVRFAFRFPGARGVRQLPDVLRLSDARSGSPMETRIRVAIVDGGLATPVLQHPVGPYFLDLAYPGIRLGIEYNGGDHLTQDRTQRDLVREAYLARAGWEVLRFSGADVVRRPRTVAAAVRARLTVAARARGVAVHELDPR